MSIHIKHYTVVYLIVERKNIFVRERRIQIECLAEIIGRTLGTATWTVIQFGGSILLHDGTRIAIAEGCFSRTPSVPFLFEGI